VPSTSRCKRSSVTCRRTRHATSCPTPQSVMCHCRTSLQPSSPVQQSQVRTTSARQMHKFHMALHRPRCSPPFRTSPCSKPAQWSKRILHAPLPGYMVLLASHVWMLLHPFRTYLAAVLSLGYQQLQTSLSSAPAQVAHCSQPFNICLRELIHIAKRQIANTCIWHE
jgi:hypothetical protein